MMSAFRAKHGPDMICILVLDNAPYHHGRHEDGFFCQEHNKAEIVVKLKELGCQRLAVRMTPDTKSVAESGARPTIGSPPEMFIGWYVLDVDDSECFEVTHLEEDDSEYEQGTVLCVTKMARQRGTKTWFSINEEKAAVHGLQTWQSLVASEVIQVIGFGDEAYVRISQFWRDYKDSPTASKPDPRELLERPEPDIGGGAPKTHVYPVEKLSLRYNGRGAAGTGGPKLRWL